MKKKENLTSNGNEISLFDFHHYNFLPKLMRWNDCSSKTLLFITLFIIFSFRSNFMAK